MELFDKLLKRKSEVYAKKDICFVVEAMDEPTLKDDNNYVRAGYFNSKKTTFTDLRDNRSYKCSVDDNGVFTIDGKQMTVLENKGEVYSYNYEQNRYFRPLVKSKAGEYSWVDSVRVASGECSEDNLWVMFANGDGFQKYFSFLLDDDGKLTKSQIKMILKDFNDSAEYIVTREIKNSKENEINSL